MIYCHFWPTWPQKYSFSSTKDVDWSTQSSFEAVDSARVVISLICDKNDLVVFDVADLLSGLVRISVAELREGEFMSVVWHQ